MVDGLGRLNTLGPDKWILDSRKMGEARRTRAVIDKYQTTADIEDDVDGGDGHPLRRRLLLH
jgi:hypothetical protein